MKRISLDAVTYEPRLDHEKVVVLTDEDFGSTVKLQLVRLSAGQRVRPHVHKVRTELLQIIEGEGTVLVNGEKALDKKGDFVLVQPDDVHELINSGDGPLVVAVFRTNDPGDEDMIWVEEN